MERLGLRKTRIHGSKMVFYLVCDSFAHVKLPLSTLKQVRKSVLANELPYVRCALYFMTNQRFYRSFEYVQIRRSTGFFNGAQHSGQSRETLWADRGRCSTSKEDGRAYEISNEPTISLCEKYPSSMARNKTGGFNEKGCKIRKIKAA